MSKQCALDQPFYYSAVKGSLFIRCVPFPVLTNAMKNSETAEGYPYSNSPRYCSDENSCYAALKLQTASFRNLIPGKQAYNFDIVSMQSPRKCLFSDIPVFAAPPSC